MRKIFQIENVILAILYFLYSQIGFSQIELKNKVTDFTTLMPVESASIYIQNTTIGTVTNVDGRFFLIAPREHIKDTLVISSIGYKSYKLPIDQFNNDEEIFLDEDIAALDEVLLIAETRPTTGNDVVLKSLEKLEINMPQEPYLLKGFLRHKERNKREFKWLIESAITVYDSAYGSDSSGNLRINVDEVRKSYDMREVDSLFTYASYLTNQSNSKSLKKRNLKRDTIKTSSLVKAIKWNDNRINGLDNLLKGKLNLVRNKNLSNALFNESLLERHNFIIDTVLVDDGRKIYKIKIDEGNDYVDLKTPGIFNDGYKAQGWLYIYWDNYAIKRIEYDLVASSETQKKRSKDLFGTQINHKLIMTFMEFNDTMYPNYIYYETPKLVNVGIKPTEKISDAEKAQYNREERYYYTVQEILFTDVVFNEEDIGARLNQKWDSDIFAVKPYNKVFWKTYNTLLESDEEEQLIRDLTRRSTLFKE